MVRLWYGFGYGYGYGYGMVKVWLWLWLWMEVSVVVCLCLWFMVRWFQCCRTDHLAHGNLYLYSWLFALVHSQRQFLCRVMVMVMVMVGRVT